MGGRSRIQIWGQTVVSIVLLSPIACDGTSDQEALDPTFNVTVAPPRGLPAIIEVSGPLTDPAPPFAGVFRIKCGECTRFNFQFADSAWAAGYNCADYPGSSVYVVRPVRVKGPNGRVVELRACCPHNKECNPGGPTGDGGADFLIGVRPNGSLAVTTEELAALCGSFFIRGAIDYSNEMFSRYQYADISQARSMWPFEPSFSSGH
jgi:hypothetical protein